MKTIHVKNRKFHALLLSGIASCMLLGGGNTYAANEMSAPGTACQGRDNVKHFKYNFFGEAVAKKNGKWIVCPMVSDETNAAGLTSLTHVHFKSTPIAGRTCFIDYRDVFGTAGGFVTGTNDATRSTFASVSGFSDGYYNISCKLPKKNNKLVGFHYNEI